MKQKLLVAALVSSGLVSPLAHATNGMNLEGYGPIAAAMGGASMAYDNGTAAVMNNPATLGMMKGDAQLDVAVGVLGPSISAKAGPMVADSSATAFYMPAVGYARRSGQLVYGAGVFSQGGMGTEYGANTFMAAGSGQNVRSEVGVGRVILPLAYQVNERFTLGGSVDYVWAGMDLKMAMPAMQMAGLATGGSLLPGLGAAVGAGATWGRVDFSDSSAFTGAAKGSGYAFKLGGTFKATDKVTLGATYHSKTSISDLTSSAALSLGNAAGVMQNIVGSISVHNFQWPETYGLGMAVQATDQLMLVADYKRIGWKSVMQNFSMSFTSAAGNVNFVLPQNWSDQDVFELGGAYRMSDALTLRAGVNIANNPVPNNLMNPLFPAIGKSHETVGASYAFNPVSSLHFNYVYMNKVTATNAQGVAVDFGGFSSQLLYSHKF